MNDQIGEAMAQERLVALLSGFFDPATFLTAAAILAAVTALAAALPAWRVTRTDPASVLKEI